MQCCDEYFSRLSAEERNHWSSCLLLSLVPWAEMKCMSVMHCIDVWICQGTTN